MMWSLRSLKCGFHMIATIAERFFPAFAAIIAIIWKPAIRVLSEIYFAWKGLKTSRVKFCLKHFLFVVLWITCTNWNSYLYVWIMATARNVQCLFFRKKFPLLQSQFYYLYCKAKLKHSQRNEKNDVAYFNLRTVRSTLVWIKGSEATLF